MVLRSMRFPGLVGPHIHIKMPPSGILFAYQPLRMWILRDDDGQTIVPQITHIAYRHNNTDGWH